jgi:hypothetical protein
MRRFGGAAVCFRAPFAAQGTGVHREPAVGRWLWLRRTVAVDGRSILVATAVATPFV